MKFFKNIPRLVEVVTLIGLGVYIAQSWYFAHSQVSIGDEGAYLYKGYMFARGEYYPFQEYAFWTNKAPLAFLIPGYIQLWFGAGLRTARYFAVILSILTLVGIWITAQRLGGKNWAAIAVWVFTLSDLHISISSLALSQGLIACMMAWMFVLVLGEDRPVWQLLLGSALSVLVVMTRQNMILVPILLAGYIFWQYGNKTGWWALTVMAVLFIGFHVYYWPNILQLWAPWLPRAITPFLNDFRSLGTLGEAGEGAGSLGRWQAFATGTRDHFFILLGSLSALVLWPKREAWKSMLHFRTAIFLAVLFFGLHLMHAWASLFKDHCVYCYSSYQVFYSVAGFLLVLVVFSNGVRDTFLRRFVLFVVLLFLSGSMGLAYYQRWGGWLLDHVYLIRPTRFSTVPLGDVLTYVFGLSTSVQLRVASAGAGLMVGLIFIILIWAIRRFAFNKITDTKFGLVHVVLVPVLLAGTILPIPLGNRIGDQVCSTDYVAVYEQAGGALSDLIPPDSLVYWKGGGRQLALMLYLKGIQIFAPQIHAGGGYISGDSDWLLRFGRYNEELDKQWRASADYLLIWEQSADIEFYNFVDQNGFEAVPVDMGEFGRCADPLLVFRRHS